MPSITWRLQIFRAGAGRIYCINGVECNVKSDSIHRRGHGGKHPMIRVESKIVKTYNHRVMKTFYENLAVMFLLVTGNCFAHAKTDIVTVVNGNEVNCEVRRLKRGLLSVKTDSLSDISIRWEDVTRVRSLYVFEIILDDGSYHFSALDPDPAGNLLLPGQTAIPLIRVVSLAPIESRITSRFSGSADVGYSFQKADTTTQLNLNGDLAYAARRRTAEIQVSGTLITREGTEATRKTQSNFALNQTLSRGAFVLAIGQYSTNNQLNLIHRYLGGGGLGRYLVHTNRSIFSLVGGAAYSIERYAGEPRRNNAEALLGLNAQTFRLRSPKLDITGDVKFWPNLTTRGRFRLDVQAKAQVEVHRNLFIAVQLLDNYDRKNPTTGLPLNDYGLVMSVGYKFNR